MTPGWRSITAVTASDLGAVDGGADEGRDDLDGSVVAVGDFEIGDGILRMFETLDEHVAQRVGLRAVCRESHLVGRLGGALVEWCAVDGVDQRPQQRVAGEDEGGEKCRLGDPVAAGTGADGGRAPERRGRVEAANVETPPA